MILDLNKNKDSYVYESNYIFLKENTRKNISLLM